MAIAVSLEPAAAAAVPGEPLELTLTVRNDSGIVEGYVLRAVGDLAAYITVTPDRLSVYPGTAETATVAILIPRSAAVPAGEVGVGVHVSPTAIAPASEDAPADADPRLRDVVAEATVTVEPFTAIGAEVVPRISRSRGRKRVRVAVDNNGNAALTATLVGQGSEKFRVTPREPEVWIDSGHAGFIRVGLAPRRRLWRGQAVSHPYSVIVTSQGGEPVVADATHVQEPVFPPWFWKALLALAALIALLILLWNLLLKPTIEDVAREAVVEPIADVQQAAQAAEEAASGAEQAAEAAQAAAEGAGAPVQPPPAPPAPVNRTYTFALVANDEQSITRSLPEAVPENSVLQITDLVLNNPQGDVGTLRLLIGNTVLINLGTENYRDLDLHFVTPIEVPAGSNLTAAFTCIAPGQPPGRTPSQCLSNVLITAKLAVIPQG